ncbi:hypothetical protein Clacol_010139 [Clathrus columnatus]|uniref:Uncharacterized protein n=1 Tax=Clathrus columnatus TaxID=1419009 RepID=A0AAV5AU83_9AGAM|nr:hypothetical protein Clacol_010139 [Clathrus columnatus]
MVGQEATLVGQGRIQRIKETSRQNIICGEVTCQTQGESSWNVEHIEVKVTPIIKGQAWSESRSVRATLPVQRMVQVSPPKLDS